MLGSHYRQPIDWTVDRLVQAKHTLQEFAEEAGKAPAGAGAPNPEVVATLLDDLNTPSAISILHGLVKSAKRGDAARAAELRATLELMGLFGGETEADLNLAPSVVVDRAKIEAKIAARVEAKKRKDFAESDRIRDELAAMGIIIEDGKNGTTWKVKR